MHSIGQAPQFTNPMVQIRDAILLNNRRANEVFQNAHEQYNWLKSQLKEDQSINFVCYIGGCMFDIHSMSAHGHFLEIRGKDSNGNFHVATAPIEQIAFDIIISKKVNDEPPREIGFKMEPAKKQE